MKIYISADMEGVAGIAHWEETELGEAEYQSFREQMTKEVAAACHGCNDGGADEILVKDAHDSGRNIHHSKLPVNTKLNRVFNGDPFCMMAGLDESYDAAVMIGYHSHSGSVASPLSHTLSTGLNYLKINGVMVTEFYVNALTAAYVGVPVVMVSGDEGLCDTVGKVNPSIETVATNTAEGTSVTCRHPQTVIDEIRSKVRTALKKELKDCLLALPPYFEVELSFKQLSVAHRGSFYPGMTMDELGVLRYETDDYYEVLRMLAFVCG